MGLTAAGGAIISTPLFVYFCGMNLHQATAYSLVAVLAGASFNGFMQRRHARLPLSLILGTTAILATFVFTPLKERSPEWVLKIVFCAICLLGLKQIWFPPKTKGRSRIYESNGSRATRSQIAKLCALGFFLGAIISFTGMGGGLLLVPILIAYLGLPAQIAVPTTLITSGMSSTVSLILQRKIIFAQVEPHALFALFGGTIAAAFFTKFLIDRIHPHHLERTRKWALSAVIIFAICSLLK